MDRLYDAVIREHIETNRQMAFLSGPRQVGKTTTARSAGGTSPYLNWDIQADRQVIVRGPDYVADKIHVNQLREKPIAVVFDEIHKYRAWKTFLKGMYDGYSDRLRIIATGSARMEVYRRGGDSLMGRYFLYRMHPVTIAELVHTTIRETEIRPPERPGADALETLFTFGGFPEPFLKQSTRFYNRWRRTRSELLFREDLRDLTRIQEAGQVEILAELLAGQTGSLVNYSTLAVQVQVSVDTIRRWIRALESLYYCFTIRPWFRSIPKTLRKQPKVYLWDWSLVADPGARWENLVASHLHKAVQHWTDIGLGEYSLHYLRDTVKREVDFLVARNGEPWFLVEAKTADTTLSPSLKYFSTLLGSIPAFQVVRSLPYVDADAFARPGPLVVSGQTMLSQLV